MAQPSRLKKAVTKAFSQKPSEEELALYKDVESYILKHPAAQSTPPAAAQTTEKAIYNTLEAATACIQRLMKHNNAETVTLCRNGDLIANKYRNRGILINDVTRKTNARHWFNPKKDADAWQTTKKAAPGLWAWIYDLTATGKAPHLLRGLKIDITEEGPKVRKNPGDQSTETMRRLWQSDCEKAAIPTPKTPSKDAPQNK
ncbi:MAG: hypothetical protein OXT65_12580 [Alphaproteobacteria bacterium]|nr:hypothetical protein [Alphaproteobacteria bacterium]